MYSQDVPQQSSPTRVEAIDNLEQLKAKPRASFSQKGGLSINYACGSLVGNTGRVVLWLVARRGVRDGIDSMRLEAHSIEQRRSRTIYQGRIWTEQTLYQFKQISLLIHVWLQQREDNVRMASSFPLTPPPPLPSPPTPHPSLPLLKFPFKTCTLLTPSAERTMLFDNHSFVSQGRSRKQRRVLKRWAHCKNSLY